MKALDRRIRALMNERTGRGHVKQLPLIVDEKTKDAQIERLRRGGRIVFRSGDPALYDEFV